MIIQTFNDFETYCEEDIGEVGAWKYSLHSSLDVLCFSWTIDNGPIETFSPYVEKYAEPPYSLFEAIDNGAVFNAWNVFFERAIWNNFCVPKLGWPEIPPYQWFDSAAKAAANAIPIALEKAGIALNIPADMRKLDTGGALLNKFSIPQKNGRRIMPHESPNDFNSLIAYNRQDVIAERYIDSQLLDLKPHERDFWYIDQKINLRGIPIDTESVRKIRDRVSEQMDIANRQLPKLTGGMIDKITQVKRIVTFCQSRGVKIDDCQSGTVDKVLEFAEKNPDKIQDKHKPALELLEIRKWFGKTATSKYDKMLQCVDTNDNRVRGTMVYSGAHTGRWTGRLIQPHNYFKPTINKRSDVDHFVDCVANRTIECVEAIYQRYIHAAASATRMMIAAPKGSTFWIGDYNAIEARGVFWLAGDEAGLDYYRENRDPYCEMATSIFGRKITKADEHERFIGKGIILGAGFGLGVEGFIRNMEQKWNTTIPRQIAENGIYAYRAKHGMVKKLWQMVEYYSIMAVRNPGKVYSYRQLKFLKPVDRDFFYIMLPSRRLLAYPFPKIEQKKTSWGEVKDTLTYKVWSEDYHKWMREPTYGGKLTENIDQATARDVMAHHMTEIEFAGIPITFTVHDEMIAEISEQFKNEQTKIIRDIVKTMPDWASDFPVIVEDEISHRYKKA